MTYPHHQLLACCLILVWAWIHQSSAQAPDFCRFLVNPCRDPNAICTNQADGVSCSCPPGFTYENPHCVPTAAPASAPSTTPARTEYYGGDFPAPPFPPDSSEVFLRWNQGPPQTDRDADQVSDDTSSTSDAAPEGTPSYFGKILDSSFSDPVMGSDVRTEGASRPTDWPPIIFFTDAIDDLDFDDSYHTTTGTAGTATGTATGTAGTATGTTTRGTTTTITTTAAGTGTTTGTKTTTTTHAVHSTTTTSASFDSIFSPENGTTTNSRTTESPSSGATGPTLFERPANCSSSADCKSWEGCMDGRCIHVLCILLDPCPDPATVCVVPRGRRTFKCLPQ